MRATTAYFAGVGTVAAALLIGLGGGLTVSNIMSPHTPRVEMSKLELRMSARPIPATNASSDPQPNASPAPVKPAEAPAAENAVPPPAAPPQQAATPVRQAVAAEPVKTPEDAFARASDSDVKSRADEVRASAAEMRARDREARREARRAAEEQRRAERRQYWLERRQRWAERRRPTQEQELREVERKVREETEPREAFASEPAKREMPRIRLFGEDD